LTKIILYADLELTKEKRAGLVWFFNDDYHTAHNGVHFNIDFRVYKLKKR